MFSLKEKFLDDGIDVPFYNDIPKLSTFDWLVVLASVLLVIGYKDIHSASCNVCDLQVHS